MHDRKTRNLERWFGLHNALLSGARPTARELADRFGVTVRTIWRDLDALEQMNVPIVRENGRYSVVDSYRMKTVQFTPEEVLALAAALNFAGRNKALLASKAATTALDKLLSGMPSAQQELAAGVGERVVVDPLPGHSVPALPHVESALRQALQGGHPVRLRYQGLNDAEAADRVVHPYGLAYRGTALYLIGYCRLRRQIRTFRANRVLAAAVVPEVFIRPAHFDLEGYLAQMWGIEDGPEYPVTIRFTPQVARLALETVWHPSQSTERLPDGSVLLKMTTRGMNELARWLAGYGGTVEALEPAELRTAVLKLGRGIVERYGDQT